MNAIQKFELVKDDHGYARAIAIEGWYVIHLEPGTVRNEENAEKLLAVLNAAVGVVNNPAWSGFCNEDVALEVALRNIQPTETAT